jgi:2-methylcitrate dehydratase PrpD
VDETRKLARFLSDLSFAILPDNVVETAKLCILDTIGVGVAASRRPWPRMVADMIAEDGGSAESTLWGLRSRATASQAALFNGTSAHGIEMDDRVPKAHVHPGCYAVSSAMAAAEKTAATGRQLIAGVVSGYELGLRVGYAVRFEPGLHRSGHKGVWLSVAAAVSVLGLDSEQALDAFGLAGSMASGLMEYSRDSRGTMVKRLHAGFAASNGIMAARLAQRGFTGPATVLEGPLGYCRVFSRGGAEPKIGELTADLGGHYKILDRELKPYAAWGGGHNAIDAVGKLLDHHDLKVSDIASVSIGGSSLMVVTHEMREPRSIMAAQHSLPFLASVAFCRGPRAFMDPDGLWTDELLDDADVIGLSRRTEIHIDHDLDEMSVRDRHYGGARIIVTCRDGQQFEETVLRSKGTLENPLTAEEVTAKFVAITSQVLPRSAIDEIVRLVDSLEDLADVRQLGDVLAENAEA